MSFFFFYSFYSAKKSLKLFSFLFPDFFFFFTLSCCLKVISFLEGISQRNFTIDHMLKNVQNICRNGPLLLVHFCLIMKLQKKNPFRVLALFDIKLIAVF